MKFEIKHRRSGEVLFAIETSSLKLAAEAAVKSGAILRGAKLRRATLWGADLREANLRGADLREANLRGADLGGADLWEADLRGANLWRANLREADLDFSTFPFWCGSFRIMADLRLGAQLAYHFCMIDFKDCKEAVEAQKNLKDLANRFHRIKIDCDVLE